MRDLTAPALIDGLTLVVSQAAAEILRIAGSVLTVREKSDATPVTLADEAAESILLEGISKLLPDLEIVSEEKVARGIPCKPEGTFVLVDPLDGTREILAGRDEYTINVAIIHRGRPVVGLLAAPARSLVWRGAPGYFAERLTLRPGDGADRAQKRQPIHIRSVSGQPVALVSRSHLDSETERFLSRWPNVEKKPCGSALKFGLLAQGDADVYPRLSPTSEWDIAAGDAILTAAGGMVVTPGGEPVIYGPRSGDYRVPAFIAWGDASARK
jgi:3'(2'), 5'-bisphosphate nucleotidase